MDPLDKLMARIHELYDRIDKQDEIIRNLRQEPENPTKPVKKKVKNSIGLKVVPTGTG